jgi:hypothetical protein
VVNSVRDRLWSRLPVPVGRRARLLLAGLLAVGTAVPLVLAAPGGPGTSFLRVAAPLTDHPETTTTTTTTLPHVAASTTTTPTTVGGKAGPKTTTPPTSVTASTTRQTSMPRTTSANETAPPTSVSSPGGAATWCTASELGLSVATGRASYNPGDTLQINVDAVNRSNVACVLSDPTRFNSPTSTCQPDTLVEAPYSANFPGLPVVADVGPPCNANTHLLAAGDAWHSLITVSIPSDGSWSPGSYTVHSEWQAAGALVSADTSFDLTGSTTTTTTPVTTTPPSSDTTTTVAG